MPARWKRTEPKNRKTELRIADFKGALKIAPAKTDGNLFVKRAAVFYWLIGIVIAAMAIATAFYFDDAVRDFIAQHQNPMMRAFMRNVSLYGDWPSHLVLGLLLLGIAWQRQNKKWMRIFLSMLVAMAMAGVAGTVIKRTIPRARPSVKSELRWSGPRFMYQISRVSVRSRRGLDRIFWCFDFRTPSRRPRLSPHPDSDRALANVPWRALRFGRCLRGSPGDHMRCRRLAFFRARTE